MKATLKGILFWTAMLAAGLVSVTWAHGASVTLAWDRNPEPDIAGYRLYLNGRANYWHEVGNTNYHTISNLCEGISFCFNVTAYDLSGLESDFSDTLCYAPPVNTNPIPVITRLETSTSAFGPWMGWYSITNLDWYSITNLQPQRNRFYRASFSQKNCWLQSATEIEGPWANVAVLTSDQMPTNLFYLAIMDIYP